MTEKIVCDIIILIIKRFFEVVRIKRFLVSVLICLFLITCFFTGCNNKKGGVILLSKTPFAEEQIYKVGKNKVDVIFDLPSDGYLKLLAYNNTEYEDACSEAAEISASFFSENEKLLYENVGITNGYTDKLFFKRGRITVELVPDKDCKDMSELAVSWAFALKDGEQSIVKENQISVAEANENKKAEFKFSAKKSGIYSIECSEACMSEYDCYFTVFDSDNKPIADKLFIHSNEWISRKVFLPKGEYKIMVEDVFAVATCTVKTEKIFENVASENDENLKLPLKVGFLKDENNSTNAQFEAQSGKLAATVVGTDTYYDSEQEFKIEITDNSGRVLLIEECEGSMEWNIPESLGKGFVKLTLEGNGIVDLRIE